MAIRKKRGEEVAKSRGERRGMVTKLRILYRCFYTRQFYFSSDFFLQFCFFFRCKTKSGGGGWKRERADRVWGVLATSQRDVLVGTFYFGDELILQRNLLGTR